MRRIDDNFKDNKDMKKEKKELTKEIKEIRLKVVEALQDDAYKGIARIDPQLMKMLGLNRGDVISIKGGRETAAIVDRAYPADVGEGIIRVDGLIRKNAKTGVSEQVIVKKAAIKPAVKVIIAPAQQGIMVQGDPEMIKSSLFGRAVSKGDIISLGGGRRREQAFGDPFSDMFGSDMSELFGGAFGFGGFQNIKFVIVSTNPGQMCLITEKTELVLQSKGVEVSDEVASVPDVTYEDIGGLTEEVKKVREMVELHLKHPEIFEKLGIEPPKGVLMHGPPGTGKTLLAKAVANESEANFILLNGPEIMSKFYGESEKKIRDIFEEAEKNAPSIIFIDEIDAIAPKREDVQGEVERRVVSQMLTMMDGLKNRGKVVVIGATNRPNSIDPALRRPGRFDREIEINVPDKDGRLNILKIHTRNMPLEKVSLDILAGKTHGFVGADIAALSKEAAMSVLRKLLPELKLEEDEPIPQEVLEKIKIRMEDFESALKVVRPSAMREVLVETPNIGWNDIGGLEKTKEALKESVEWPMKYSSSFKRLGITPPRGILLYGPPGTGKTLLAKAVAKESEANFIQVKGPSLLSMWVGKSLPYGEEILARDSSGVVKRMKIGDIVENKLDVQVLAFDKDKRVRFARVTDFIKHKLDSKLMEVTTSSGRKIKVTDYHSLFSFIGGKIVDVPTNQLIPNESYIVIPKNLNLPREEIKEINLYEHFKTDDGVFVGNVGEYLERAKKIIGLDDASKILGVSKKYFADIIFKNLPVSISKFDNLIRETKLALDFNDINIKLKGSTYSYPVMFKLNNSLWRLMGVWIAEGDYNSGTIRITNQNPEIRRDIKMICEDYGFSISEMETCITINSTFLLKVFKNVFKLNGGAENKGLPEIAFILNEEGKANLLKGYFSGDGSIYSDDRGKFKIEACTISKKLANDLLYLLLDFGIVARLYEKESSEFMKSYRIIILGVKNFERFSKIGFIDLKRNQRINQYIKSRAWARSDLIPLSGELYNLASSSSSVYSTNRSIGKEALKSILIMVDKEKSKYKEYWDLVDGDLYLDLVTDVKIIEPEEYVYDIEVSGNHNFVGGFGGVIAHNSEEGVRKIFERARQVAPCVVFFDEIDSLAGRRGVEQGTKVTERVLNQLLAEIDGIEDLKDVTIIGATNRPDMLDPALLRPGRFDRVILVDIPDEESRRKIFEVHLKNTPFIEGWSSDLIRKHEEDKLNPAEKKLFNDNESAKLKILDSLIGQTEGYVGADIEGLVREASMHALREDMNTKTVSKKDFEEAMKKVRASVSVETARLYKKMEELYLKNAKAGLENGPLYAG